MNGLSRHYHLDECTFILGASGVFLDFLSRFSMKLLVGNRIAPDGTPHSAALHLKLCCLPMTHKRDARLS